MNPLIVLISSPLLWLFLLIMFGFWLFCWAAWGGSISCTTVPNGEAGLGLNPPKFK